jgi:hypothetical protein
MVRQGTPELTEGLTMIHRQAHDVREYKVPGTAWPYPGLLFRALCSINVVITA